MNFARFSFAKDATSIRYQKSVKMLQLVASIMPVHVLSGAPVDLSGTAEALDQGLIGEMSCLKNIFKRFQNNRPPSSWEYKSISDDHEFDLKHTFASHINDITRQIDPEIRKQKIKDCIDFMRMNEPRVFKLCKAQMIGILTNGHLDLTLAIMKNFKNMRKLGDPFSNVRHPCSPLEGQLHYPTQVLVALQNIKKNQKKLEDTERLKGRLANLRPIFLDAHKETSAAIKDVLKILKFVSSANPEAFRVLCRIQDDIDKGVTVHPDHREALDYLNSYNDRSFQVVTDYIKKRIAKGYCGRIFGGLFPNRK